MSSPKASAGEKAVTPVPYDPRMSLLIDVDNVTAVLLVDGWHDVADHSFTLDSYEFVWANQHERDKGDFTTLHGGGQSDICATGFMFSDGGGSQIAGPLTSVLAVKAANRLALDFDAPATD